MLLGDLAAREPGRIVIPGIRDDEVPGVSLVQLGFARGRETIGVASEAQSRA